MIASPSAALATGCQWNPTTATSSARSKGWLRDARRVGRRVAKRADDRRCVGTWCECGEVVRGAIMTGGRRRPRHDVGRGGEKRGDIGRTQSLVGSMVEHPAKENLPGHREIGRQWNWFAQTTSHDLTWRAFVDASTHETLQQNDPKGPHVRARTDLSVLELFGRHVRDGAEHRPRNGECRGVMNLRDAEVAELCLAARGHQDVGRLDVAVNDAAFVHVRQSVGECDAERRRLGGRQLGSLSQGLRQCHAFDELHDEVRLIGSQPGFKESNESGVVKTFQDASLLSKSAHELRIT